MYWTKVSLVPIMSSDETKTLLLLCTLTILLQEFNVSLIITDEADGQS